MPTPRLDFAYCKFTLEQNQANDDESKVNLNFMLVHGGMDTVGNVYDDCFLISLV
jgi:hypothetical protein